LVQAKTSTSAPVAARAFAMRAPLVANPPMSGGKRCTSISILGVFFTLHLGRSS
jgi:hypothetical protein